MNEPVRYSPDVEDVKPDENKTVDRLNESFDQILETTAEDYGHAVRSVHAKGHALLRGTMTVPAGLPPELAQGLFATPAEHDVFIRISTNPGDILDDAISLPRGLALKVLDVPGERLPAAEGTTQDFIMVNSKSFQAKDADKFADNIKLLARTTDKAEGSKKALSALLRGVNAALGTVGLESPVLGSLGGAPQVHPLGETYNTLTPFRFGDYIGKFRLVPTAPAMTALTGTTIDLGGHRDGIRETMQRDTQATDMTWDFQVQLNRDLESMPVEDPTVEWKEEDSPFETVATIRAPAQDSWSEDRVQEIDEQTRFSVWTGIVAHQPLGNVNRARRDTYRHSANFRAAHNHCPIHEPA